MVCKMVYCSYTEYFPNFTKLLNYKKIKQKQDKTRFDNAKIKHVENLDCNWGKKKLINN